MHATSTESNGLRRIFHVSSRKDIMELRDEILRMNGFHVQSTVYSAKAIDEVLRMDYNLVLIDVESDVTVKSARDLCDTIKKADPGQHVATKWVYLRFVKNYRPLHFVCSS